MAIGRTAEIVRADFARPASGRGQGHLRRQPYAHSTLARSVNATGLVERGLRPSVG